MKVVCYEGKAVEDGWLQSGVEYLVLFIQTYTDGRQMFLIWSDEQSCVALFPVSDFTVTNAKVPPNWVISTDLNGCLVIGPQSWLEGDFWDRYHDGDPSAEEIFKREVKKMT